MPESIDFADKSSHYMEMPSGKRFYMADPRFDIEDIAYTLAGQARFNGTGTRNQHDHSISVAEHSVRASYMILEGRHWTASYDNGTKNRKRLALIGLMHDATEAFLGDVPGPWKALLPDFCKLESYLWCRICDWLSADYGVDLPFDMPSALKEVDWRCLFLEAREVMKSQGRDWVMYDINSAPDVEDSPCYWWSPAEAEAQFLRRFYELVS